MRSRKWRLPFALIRQLPALRSFLPLGDAGAGALDAPHRFCDFVLAHDQRRQQSHHVVTSSDGDHLVRPQLVDELSARHHRAQADEKPFAAQLGDDRGIAVPDLGEPLLEEERNAAHMLEEAIGEHHVEQRAGRGHRQWIAAKGRAVRAGGHALRGLSGGEAGPDGEATTEGLGKRHDVGGDAAALIGEEFPGAPEPGLHLVEHQQQSVFVAQPPQRPQEFGRHHAHAALPHDRLDHDRGSLGPDRTLGRVEIGERHLVKTFDHRAESVEILFLAPGGQRGERAPVEGTLESDDAVAFRPAARRLVFARHFDRAFHRLGAGIAEEHHVREARRAQRSARRSLSGMR